MGMQIFENQLIGVKSWDGYTDKNHLINAYGLDPVAVEDRLIQIGNRMLGEDFYSMVMSNGVKTIKPGEDILRWRLENAKEENYPLIAAYVDEAMSTVLATGTIPAGYVIAGGQEFFLLFEGRPFSKTELITSHNPDAFRFWVKGDPQAVGDNKFLYRVELNATRDSIAPLSEVVAGTRWSADASLVPDTRSYEGADINFYTHAMMETRMSQFRLQHEMEGRMFDIKPMAFFVEGKDKKKNVYWISNVEFAMIKKARMITANIIMNGQSNVNPDGSVTNIDKNGSAATTGPGFKQQWSSTNLHRWSLKPNLKFLTEIAMDAVVNKIPMSGRKMIIKAGEYGLVALANMVQEELGSSAWAAKPWNSDTTGRNFKWNGNEVFVNMGQIMGVATINGIEFNFVVDPSKDMPGRNKEYHPLGGLVSSYEYEIMGFGNEKENMKILRREGESPIWGVLEGMRGWNKSNTSFTNPKALATAVDASTIHYFEPGVGAVVYDPTLVVRYYPDILKY